MLMANMMHETCNFVYMKGSCRWMKHEAVLIWGILLLRMVLSTRELECYSSPASTTTAGWQKVCRIQGDGRRGLRR